MAFEHYIRSGQKRLRCGYTTGTCAALAASGAAWLLLTGEVPSALSLMTPKGWEVTVRPDECRMTENGAFCAVAKDAGDDADITAGMHICATVAKQSESGIFIDGGAGVGRVTKPGLDQSVGNAAINHVPRQMITQQVKAVCEEVGYDGGLSVVISIPGGEEAAKKTFNPMLGIEGGLSILGTSGIVEPMSEQALVDTIGVELHQAAIQSKRLILAPGNYGVDFLHDQGLDELDIPVVKCSNFIGAALDMAAVEGFHQVLLAGHIGKLSKLAGGIMNTHSRYADCRTELFTAHAAICGASREVCTALMGAATTDACIELLDHHGLRDQVLSSLIHQISLHLDRRVKGAYQIGAVLFSNVYGILGQTEEAKEILEAWK